MGYALYKLSKEDATIFVKLTEKCWNGKERDLTKLNKYERAVLLKLMDEAGEHKPKKPVKKYNKWHDPKTGRFTSGPAGATTTVSRSKVIDGVEVPDHVLAGGEAFVQHYVSLANRIKTSDAINEERTAGMKEILPNAVIWDVSGVDAELWQDAETTLKHLTDRYPILKEAVTAIRTGTSDSDLYLNSNIMAYCGSNRTSDLVLNLDYYGNKQKLVDGYAESVQKKFHPEGTDYKAVIAHEMGHAVMYQLSEKSGVNMSVRLQNAVIDYFEKKQGGLTYGDVVDGLSQYATSESGEFAAEIFAEYTMSSNPREFAMVGGQIIDSYIGMYNEYMASVSKSFSAIIRKYNKWHDPKTGRFTSAPGVATGEKAQSVVVDGIEVPELIVNSEIPGVVDTYVATMKRNIAKDEIKSVLNYPHAKVDLSYMDPDLALETADVFKRTVEQYPMLKDAIKGVKTYWSEEKTIAQYDPESRRIELNRKYYEDKSVLIDKTNESLNLKWHPEGTDYNSNIVHEMGHALDFYASEILYGEERVVFGHGTVSRKIWREDKNNSEKAGHRLTGKDIQDGLSGYAASSPHEYFAEAFAEVTCSPSPRPMAKGIWEKFEVYMNEALEKERNGESSVGKSFFAIIQKFNPYHDPKTGRFTSSPGGASSGIMANILPELKADYDKDMLTYEMLGLDPAPVHDKYELLAVLNPGTKVNIGAMPDDLRKQTVATVKQFIDKYPMAKEAITRIQVGDIKNADTMDIDYFEDNPKTMAFYDRRNGALCLNPSLYDKKGKRSEQFAEAYQATVDKGYHPKGTDYNSVIVHEMAHAVDNYYSQTSKANYAFEVKREVGYYMSKAKKDFSIQAQIDGLSEYATVDVAEFFAEAIAEYVCSPNPREIATLVGKSVDQRMNNDKYFKREYKNLYDKGDAQ